jgi:RNA polymerase sigma-70 factor, ECF subfamily
LKSAPRTPLPTIRLDTPAMDQHEANQSADRAEQVDAGLEEFIYLLTESQTSLKAYLLAALGSYDDAAEVLQRTNLVLWRNAKSFRAGADFMSWAVTLAKYEIMSFYRDRRRDRHVFSEELATLMLQTAADDLPNISERHTALRECVAQLPTTSREMIRLRYEDRKPIQQIAERLERTDNAIKSALLRIRKSLATCIRRRVGSGA